MGKRILVILSITILAIGTALAAPFGGKDDVKYSQSLWKALSKASFVGSKAITSKPYDGQPPHSMVLDTIEGTVTLRGKTNAVIVKRNYGGPGVSKQAVANNPKKYLKAVTVMFKRKGFDSDNKDWFWAKYKPDGSLQVNPKGMKLAGRVAKGKAKGCIACHKAAPGGDYVFIHDRIK